MKKTTLIFDLDNTLIDRDFAASRTCEILAARTAGSNIDLMARMAMRMYELDDNGNTPRGRLFQAVRDEFELPEDWVFEMVDAWYKVYPEQAKICEDSIPVLTKLKEKYHLGMISNGNAYSQRRKIEKTGLEPYFESIVISGEFGKDKPDRSIFEESLRQLGVTAEEAYFIGDIPWRDIAGAYRAGITPIHILRGRLNQTPCPGFLHIKDLYELEGLLEQQDGKE